MGAQQMIKGQNLPIPNGCDSLELVVRWTASGQAEVDLVALLVGVDGKVASDADMIFYNQTSTPDGSVVQGGRTDTEEGGTDSIQVDLEALRSDVARVVLAATVSEADFGRVENLAFAVGSPLSEPVVEFSVSGMTTEQAVVLGEVYRRDDQWRVRAVGQGWTSGLRGLATDFGVAVDDEDVSEGAEIDNTQRPPADGGTHVDDGATGPEATRPVKHRSVTVRGQERKRAHAPTPKLALGEKWSASRLFSVNGIGGQDEQEKRATSALLWVMSAVRPLGRALTARAGAPAGALETFLEVRFPLGERSVTPDAVIRVARGSRSWTALVEVKTGPASLGREQIESYLGVAKKQSFDAVITISNDLSPDPDILPVTLSSRLVQRVPVVHLSWAEVIHEARMLLTHHTFTDQLEIWVLAELLRYLEDPRSGALEFQDMGPHWVAVRESVMEHTLRAGDRKVPSVVGAWFSLCRQIELRLTSRVGSAVRQVHPRGLTSDPAGRAAAAAAELSSEGSLSSTFRIPDSVGKMYVRADVSRSEILVSVDVDARGDGTAARRVTWLAKQLKDAHDRTLVELAFLGRTETTCKRLAEVRNNSSILIPARDWEPAGFKLTLSSPMGTKRSGSRGSFVTSMHDAIDEFYATVVDHLRQPSSGASGAQAR